MPSALSARGAATVAAALLALLVVTAAPALAHVTLRADTTDPEAYAVYTVRVPNESDSASTTTVAVQMPDGFQASRYEPVPGWDLSIADGVLTVQAADPDAAIAPGEFRDFRFQAQNPAEAGDLVFPAIQTYDDGEVARWTGPQDADQPAPVVTIGGEGEASDDGHGEADAPETDAADAAVADDAEPASTTGDAGGGALTWIALALGAVGTVVGGLALSRRA